MFAMIAVRDKNSDCRFRTLSPCHPLSGFCLLLLVLHALGSLLQVCAREG